MGRKSFCFLLSRLCCHSSRRKVSVAGTVVCLTNTGRDSKIHMDYQNENGRLYRCRKIQKPEQILQWLIIFFKEHAVRFRHRLYPYCNQDESVRSIENERFLRRDVSRLELRDRIQVSGDHKREVRRHEDGGLFFILIYNSL